MRRLLPLLVILVLGAVILCPIIIAFEPEPMTGDFVLNWGHEHIQVPVVWSLCASAALALLYSVFRR